MIFSSPYPQTPIPSISLPAYALRHAERLGDKPALVDVATGQGLSYRQVALQSRQVAVALARRGFAKGDVLAVCSPNRPDFALAFFGAALAGGAVSPLNPVYTRGELAAQLKDARPRFALFDPALADKMVPAARDAGVETLLAFASPAVPGIDPGLSGNSEVSGWQGATLDDLLAEGAAAGEETLPTIDPAQDLVALPYSSGTTGLPKGVMLTHRNLVANMCQHAGTEGFSLVGEDSAILAPLPFFHIYGLSVILAYTLARGGTVVVMPHFDLETYLAAVETHRPNLLYLVPPLVLRLARDPLVERFDLGSVRVIISAAAPLGGGLIEEISARLGCTVLQGYGMTEASPGTHLLPLPPPPGKEDTVGVLVPGTEGRIVDPETGRVLGIGETGEIQVRGPQVMRGYLNRPAESADMLTGEGWLRTGDLGRVDKEGCWAVVDRLKELIKVKGSQVAPAELEAVLLAHPAVADVAVVRSPDEEAGEVPKAVVVLKEGHTAGAEMATALQEYVAARVAPFKQVRRVEFTSAIPRSPSGKILRRVLVERERESRQT